jgi:hypothetical protein
MFGRDPLRIIQNRHDLVPGSRLELVAADRAIVAGSMAAELVRVGADAAIVAVSRWLASADRAARHLAVECVTAAAADEEALQ